VLDEREQEVIKILSEGFTFEDEKVTKTTEFVQYVLTLIAIQILSKKFADKKDEWKMIKQKAQKYCKNYLEE